MNICEAIRTILCLQICGYDLVSAYFSKLYAEDIQLYAVNYRPVWRN